MQARTERDQRDEMRCPHTTLAQRITLPASHQEQAIASTMRIIYQPYVAEPRGSLKTDFAIACKSPDEGLRRAERAMQGRSVLGAQVVRMTHDDDASEFGEPEFLRQVGRVPEAG